MARARFPADLAYTAAASDNAPMRARSNLLVQYYLSAEGAAALDPTDLADVVSVADGSAYDASGVPVLSGRRVEFYGPATGEAVLWTNLGGVVQAAQGEVDVEAAVAAEAAARTSALAALDASKANASTVQGLSQTLTTTTATANAAATQAALTSGLAAKADAAATTTALAAKLDTTVATGTYNPILSPAATFTYNADGTPATMTVQGVTTTYGWNTDGTLATETRSGVTRTYTYSGGNLTAVA